MERRDVPSSSSNPGAPKLGGDDTETQAPSAETPTAALMAADPRVQRLREEPPTHGGLIAAMDYYLIGATELDRFLGDYYNEVYRRLTPEMQRIQRQSMLLQMAPSLEHIRDKLLDYIQGDEDARRRAQDAEELSRAQGVERAPPAPKPTATHSGPRVDNPTVLSLLEFLTMIFGGPRARGASPYTPADFQAFIGSLDKVNHLANAGFSITQLLVKVLLVWEPPKLLSALRAWVRIDLSPYEHILKPAKKEKAGWITRLKMLATRVPEEGSLQSFLESTKLFGDRAEFQLFCVVEYPKIFTKCQDNNWDLAKELVRRRWPGSIWASLGAYLTPPVLANYEAEVAMRSDLEKLTAKGAVLAAIALATTQLDTIREQLTKFKQENEGTFFGVVAGGMLAVVATVYMCLPGKHPAGDERALVDGNQTPTKAPVSTTQPRQEGAGGGAANVTSGLVPGGVAGPTPVPTSPTTSPPGSTQSRSEGFFGCGGPHGGPGGRDAALPAPAPPPVGCTSDGWCKVALPAGARTVERLRRIHGLSAKDIWFAGDPGILLHFDGQTLQSVDQPNLPQRMPALFAQGETLWAGGNGGNLLRRQGSTWAREIVGGKGATAVVVIGDVAATGSLDKAQVQQALFGRREELAACYRSRLPDNPEQLRGAALTFTVSGKGTVLSPALSNIENAETAACIVQAAQGLSFPGTQANSTEVSVELGFQGSAGEPTLDGAFIRSIGSVGPEVWAVGSLGLILRRQEDRWVQVPSGTKRTLHALWSSGPGDAWAAGEHGTLLHYAGGAWEAVSLGTKKDLLALWGSGPKDIWAVGEGGYVIHYDGTTWGEQRGPSANILFGVSGSGPNDVWMVGERGVVLHWDGKNIAQMRSGLEADLTDLLDVWAAGTDEVWAAGKGGVLLRHRNSSVR